MDYEDLAIEGDPLVNNRANGMTKVLWNYHVRVSCNSDSHWTSHLLRGVTAKFLSLI